jgi:hypothetical protein
MRQEGYSRSWQIEHANETYPEVKHKLFDALDLPQDKTVLNKILSREKVPVKDEVIHFAKNTLS